MKKFSRQLLDIRIKFLLIPGVPISPESSLKFQAEIRKAGLEYSGVNLHSNAIVIERSEPSPLKIVVGMAQPPQPICELTIVAEMPKTGIAGFCKDAEAAIIAFQTTWPSPAWQTIKCDAGIRELHETESEHAFKEIWEDRLGQTAKSLSIFGKPVRGGGLRLVFDPLPNDADPISIEIKIESFLNDVKKIYVETAFIWLKPNPPSPTISANERLIEMNNYIETRVQGFIMGDTNANRQ